MGIERDDGFAPRICFNCLEREQRVYEYEREKDIEHQKRLEQERREVPVRKAVQRAAWDGSKAWSEDSGVSIIGYRRKKKTPSQPGSE
jgi:hypothetical protein